MIGHHFRADRSELLLSLDKEKAACALAAVRGGNKELSISGKQFFGIIDNDLGTVG